MSNGKVIMTVHLIAGLKKKTKSDRCDSLV